MQSVEDLAVKVGQHSPASANIQRKITIYVRSRVYTHTLLCCFRVEDLDKNKVKDFSNFTFFSKNKGQILFKTKA